MAYLEVSILIECSLREQLQRRTTYLAGLMDRESAHRMHIDEFIVATRSQRPPQSLEVWAETKREQCRK